VAQHDIGVLYYRGTGVAQDYLEAARWFRRAADQGLAEAETSDPAELAKKQIPKKTTTKTVAKATTQPSPEPNATPNATVESDEIRAPDVEPAAGPSATLHLTKSAAPAPTTMARLTRPRAAEPLMWRVQLASLRSLEGARKSWNTMKRAYADVLARMEPVMERIDLGRKGVYHRLQVGPLKGRADAKALCAAIKRRIPSQACILVPPNR